MKTAACHVLREQSTTALLATSQFAISAQSSKGMKKPGGSLELVSRLFPIERSTLGWVYVLVHLRFTAKVGESMLGSRKPNPAMFQLTRSYLGIIRVYPRPASCQQVCPLNQSHSE